MDEPALTPSPETSEDAQLVLKRMFLRRRVLTAALGTGIGGALGYGLYPWLAGSQRAQFAEATKRFLQKMQEGHRVVFRDEEELPHRAQPPARIVPVILDSHGRDYEAFLKGLGLSHLQPMEIIRPHFKARGTVSNVLPPRELWKKMIPTLKLADRLREVLQVPLISINSAYRSPAYNAACAGAATHSFHLQNMALDVVYDCPPAKVAEAALALRSKKVFRGGIGRYPGFVHLDTRGKNADWG